MVTDSDTQRWQRIFAVFEEVSDASTETRDELLARLCAGDEDLHREVVALMTANAAAPRFEKGLDEAHRAVAIACIGDKQVRAMGSLGGSLATTAPAADSPPAALALGATLVTTEREHDQAAGMTVNERLSHFGLLDAFDSAVSSRNLTAVIAVLRQTKFTDMQAHETATTILSNPAYYGFR
ncbi:MAG: FAD binding domain-containing protein [Rhodanobacter sp.]|nr:FAD binding domain-containing protein [Rhodanobacter sp.]